jgi:plasmid stabilization system protein ParE
MELAFPAFDGSFSAALATSSITERLATRWRCSPSGTPGVAGNRRCRTMPPKRVDPHGLLVGRLCRPAVRRPTPTIKCAREPRASPGGFRTASSHRLSSVCSRSRSLPERFRRLNGPRCGGRKIAPQPRRQFLELAEALKVLVQQPGIGARCTARHYSDLRRLYLARTRYHVYYRVSGAKLIVLAFWHASRARAPTL